MPPAERPRVAYVLKMYPRLAETFILNEILAHEAAGLDLEIFSLRSPSDGRFHRDLGRVKALATYVPGASVKADLFWTAVREALDEFPAARGLLEFGRDEEAADIFQAIHVARMAQERGVTHLHAHFATAATNVARLASRLAGIPYSFTAHAKDIYVNSVDEQDLRRKLRDAAAVVTVSDFNRRYLLERFGQDARKVRRIYNGLDLDEFPYARNSNRPPLIVGVGRLVEKKGFADLIEACGLLKARGRDFRCEIIGGGVLEPRLRQRIADLGVGDRVRLLGPRSRDVVNRRVQQAAVLAAPCVIAPNGNRDGMPTVLLEAMALGTPCVSTAVTGIPEIIRDGETGLIAGQHDPASVADAVQRLLDDRGLGSRLAARARQLIEAEFSIRQNSIALREIFGAAPEPRVVLEVG